MPNFFDLYDYRVRNASLYRERARAVQASEDAVETWQRFRAGRDELFAAHPQSALDEEQRGKFQALCLASGKGCPGLSEPQISEPDFLEHPQPCGDLRR